MNNSNENLPASDTPSDIPPVPPSNTTSRSGFGRRHRHGDGAPRTGRGRWKWLGISAAVAGALALTACGGGWHGHQRGGFASSSPEEMSRFIDKGVNWVLSDVDANDTQKQQVAAIAKAAARDLQPLAEQHRQARGRALELLAGATVDRAAIEALRAQELQLADQASRRATQALADAMDVLTPQQRAQLAERAKRRHG